MKKTMTLSLLMLTLFTATSLLAKPVIRKAPEAPAYSDSEHKLVNYLKGTWTLKGKWKVDEDELNTYPATLEGTETYSLVLGNQFMQKQFKGKVSYHSDKVDEDKAIDLETITFFSFSYNKASTSDEYAYWYFDSLGEVVDASGVFNDTEVRYEFSSLSMNSKGDPTHIRYILVPKDNKMYTWKVMESDNSSDKWEEAASGTSTKIS